MRRVTLACRVEIGLVVEWNIDLACDASMLLNDEMKDTRRCTKCRAPKLWRIERIGIKDPQYSNGDNVPLGAMGRRGLSSPNDRFPEAYDGGHVDAYVCAACGYTELNWEGFERLRHFPPDGVHLLAPPPEGPFR